MACSYSYPPEKTLCDIGVRQVPKAYKRLGSRAVAKGLYKGMFTLAPGRNAAINTSAYCQMTRVSPVEMVNSHGIEAAVTHLSGAHKPAGKGPGAGAAPAASRRATARQKGTPHTCQLLQRVCCPLSHPFVLLLLCPAGNLLRTHCSNALHHRSDHIFVKFR